MVPTTNGKPKKHHFVPQFLLREFADDRERLIVHRLERPAPYTAKVVDIGHRNHGYTLFWPNRPANQDGLERQMAVIEGDAANVVKVLESSSAAILNEDQRVVLAFFMALLWRRNRWIIAAVREQVLDGRQLPDPGESKWAAASLGLIASLVPLLSAYALREDPSARPKEKWDGLVAGLLQFDWRIRRYRTPALLISDAPVCLSGAASPDQLEVPEVWTQHGIGVGFYTCLRLTMPLSPTLALTLHREPTPDQFAADRLNRLTVYGSREFVAHHPDWVNLATRQAQALPDLLFKQRILRRAMGPTS